MSKDSARGVASSLGKLNLASEKAASKSKKTPVADSWEDDANESSGDEGQGQGTSTPVRPGTSDMPDAPPPTPSSPSHTRERDMEYQSFQSLQFGGGFDSPSSRPGTSGDERRPDKTTSVASRLIAAGIGQKAPKRTKEQREYDQAMKLQEKKKRDQAKEEEGRKRREKEQAQKDIWGD
ncbi:hypothetical protein M409DRAFT_30385 [Zasmidium cellare ATCC 36951]|uniref:Uncharacterized protein n=1 Tax=Zasmidium cellare ATCC 36951 TaxID=1080233 RepID=A0A6A6BW83_ZASCE|nr:uncharacterized protein M409DRAFT_30385 [Zasmidium cellare ATCC 36951]KAF2159104.1 hypothetical protein M409DRAFT_30385 [Zasmidium cellare ATCC 36951]